MNKMPRLKTMANEPTTSPERERDIKTIHEMRAALNKIWLPEPGELQDEHLVLAMCHLLQCCANMDELCKRYPLPK